MRSARLLLAIVVLEALTLRGAVAQRACRRCAFGGLCSSAGELEPCTLLESRCAPNGGILVFDSTGAGAPAYWTLFASRAQRGAPLDGTLDVWADATLPMPSVPGFPGTCADGMCTGASGDFRGQIVRNRLRGIARYADGTRCDFRITIAFGVGGSSPNTYVCRDRAGAILSRGGVRLQGIRLTGCRR